MDTLDANNYAVTVGTTNTKVSEQCFQQRVSITITNISTGGQVISIGDGQEAVNGEGIVLYAGGVYNDSMDGQYKPSNSIINAISSAVGGIIAVKERVMARKGGY